MSKDQAVVSSAGAAEDESKTRRRYSEAERRRIVEETYAPGASVSVVARRHDVNANLLFKWRQRYGRREGQAVDLLPVVIEGAAASTPPQDPTFSKSRCVRKPVAASFVEIEFARGHRVRVHGAADARTVRSIIDALSR